MEETETRGMQPKPGMPRSAHCHQELKRAREGFFPGAFKGTMALPTPPAQISSLQNHEGIKFCCFKPPSLWKLVRASLGNQSSPPAWLSTCAAPLQQKGKAPPLQAILQMGSLMWPIRIRAIFSQPAFEFCIY